MLTLHQAMVTLQIMAALLACQTMAQDLHVTVQGPQATVVLAMDPVRRSMVQGLLTARAMDQALVATAHQAMAAAVTAAVVTTETAPTAIPGTEQEIVSKMHGSALRTAHPTPGTE